MSRARPRQALAAVAVGGAMAWAHAAVEPVTATTDEPRAFGYTVGDVVRRVVTIRTPPEVTLDASSLPRRSRRGEPLELRGTTLASHREAAGRRLVLTLQYQVFRAPPEVRTFEMPPVVLRFEGGARPEELRIDAWPVTVSPLAPAEVSPRTGLGAWRPDAAPLPIDTTAARTRLAAYGVGIVLAGGYLASVYLGPPWRAARRRPFGAAWRSVRRLAPGSPTAQRREAFRQMHRALDQTAGQVLVAHDVDRLIAARPAFAPLRADLVQFFERSRREFFTGTGSAQDAGWLVEFCRRCRNAERGAA